MNNTSCLQCGVCCRLFYINLSEAEYRSGDFKTVFREFEEMADFKLARESGANILEKNADGSCVYLLDNKCSIHVKRPQVCREFFCDSSNPDFVEMKRIITAAKAKK